MKLDHHEIGVGTTNELSLRVSVATLVRVLFENPNDGKLMLALERRATVVKGKGNRFIEVKSQPFGGAIKLLDPVALRNAIGDFHYDSEQSRSEEDFRIFIEPSAWETLRDFCLHNLRQTDNKILEIGPTRELMEEFADTLKINVELDQFVCKPTGIIIENAPTPTDNFYARGYFTARIYHIFEAQVIDPSLANAMMKNSEHISNNQLRELALQNAQNGGPGWANAVLTLRLNRLNAFYLTASPEARNQPISYQDHHLDETIAAILEGIQVPKYRRLW